ncbi:uncharacterized protein LOC135343265 [Halichondria panicea]|uniref:uncharacterized protein LOC135343265 n=1 Tax=Halichondria panicea TaxID=6063 RepID=UPI00312BC941
MALIMATFLQSQRETSVDPQPSRFWAKPKSLISGVWNSICGKFLGQGTSILLSRQTTFIKEDVCSTACSSSWYSCHNSKWALESSSDKETCVDRVSKKSHFKESCVDNLLDRSVDQQTQSSVKKSSSKKRCQIKSKKNITVQGKQLKPATLQNSTVLASLEEQAKVAKQKILEQSTGAPSKKRIRRTKSKKVQKPICTMSIPKKEVRGRKEIGSGHACAVKK